MSEAESKVEEKTTYKQMTEAEFASARERYELGTSRLMDLADEYGVSRQALSKRFKNHGVVAGSRAHEIAKATSETEKKAAVDAAKAAERFADTRAAKIEETRIAGFNVLKQARMLAQKTLVEEMKKPGGNPGNVEQDIRALSRYNKLVIDNVDATLRILNSDEHIDEEDLPNLIIEDLTDQEILDHHKMTGAFPEDMTLEEMLEEEKEDEDE